MMNFHWWADSRRPAVLAEVSKSSRALAQVPEEYCSDPDVVLEAITVGPDAARYASTALCLDRQFALEAVERNWEVVPFLPEALQSDRAIALAALRKDRGALKLGLQGTLANFLFTAMSPMTAGAQCDGWYRLDPSLGLLNGRPAYVSKKRRRILVARGRERWAIVAGPDLDRAVADPEFRGLLEASGGFEPDDCSWEGFAVQRSGALQDDPTLVADLVAGVPAAKVAAFYEGECLRLVGFCNEWRTTDSYLRFQRVPPSEVPIRGVVRHRLTINVKNQLSFQVASCIRPAAFRIFPGGRESSDGFFRLAPKSRARVVAAVGSETMGRHRNFHIEGERGTISIYVDICEGFAACLPSEGDRPGVAVWYEAERTKTTEEFEFTNELPPAMCFQAPEDQGPVFPEPLGRNAALRATGVVGLEVVVDAEARPEMGELIAQARELSEACFGEFVTERDWDDTEHRIALLVDTACFAVVGYCLYNTEDGQMWISQVAVLEVLRGRGLGAELVVWAGKEARMLGYGAVRLKSASSAVDFYVRMGFQEVADAKEQDWELQELGFTSAPEMELLPLQMEENERKAAERAACREREKAEHKARQAQQLRRACESREMDVFSIVGGEDKGGVLVRMGPELGSPKAIERLSTGALVQQVELLTLTDEDTGERIERLHFRRLTGTGPDEGWISVALNHKVLAERVETDAKRKVREEAERLLREEAERKQREEAERQQREEAERQAKEEAKRQREEARRKAREEAEARKEEARKEEARKEAARQAEMDAKEAREEAEARKEEARKEEARKEVARQAEMDAKEAAERSARKAEQEEEAEQVEAGEETEVAREVSRADCTPKGQNRIHETKLQGYRERDDWCVWEIVGGEDRGGVLVREGFDLGSTKLPERLSHCALVEQLEFVRDAVMGERLHFRRLTGSGPLEGWLSVSLNHKVLAEPLTEAQARHKLLGFSRCQGS